MSEDVDVVTGAFGYIGRYIARQLVESDRRVKTITTHVDKPNPFGTNVKAYPYDFEYPDRLIQTLQGTDTLYNTYWIRFEHGGQTFAQAVANTKILFDCASKAGIKKIVHISVTNASVDSPLPYYAGKGQQELLLQKLGTAYSIIRPTLVFGDEDILVNNIAWLIRKFPIFPIMGDGSYNMQPIFAEDLAKIAVESSRGESSSLIDAVGPETLSYLEFVETISRAIGRNVKFFNVSPEVGIFLGRLIGIFVRDVILTGNELRGLMSELLTSRQRPNGSKNFSDWIKTNHHDVGKAYSSELNRHFRWEAGH
jgi:NADH dehydrogenase